MATNATSDDRVAELVGAAKRDYRDVLMWAEYPGESQALWALRSDLSKEERLRLEGAVEPDGADEIRASSHLPDEKPVFHGGSIGFAPWGNVKALLCGAIP